jgi:inner membrane protein
MAPGAHLLISWLSAVPIFKHSRERRLVALAGIAPDIDGIGIVVDKLSGNKTDLYFEYHHFVGHNIFACLAIAILAAALAKSQRVAVFFVSVFVVHIHFLCDILGSRGPDGYQWPIFYFYPLNKTLEATWSGQWELSAWQNQAIMFVLFALCFLVLAKKRITFLEAISPRLESEAFVMWGKYVKRNT